MAEDEDYVCPFDEATVKKAEEELNENPQDRLSAVRALRNWVRSQPHLSCIADTRGLLSFLRGAKFSQLKAREKLEGMLTVMTLVPEWFQNIDTREKVLMEVIGSGYITPLPQKDDNGCQLILYRLGAADPSPKKVPVSHEIRAGAVAATYSILKDEAVEVHGYVFIFDFTGYTSKHMGKWGLEEVRKWFKCWQNNIPGRFKAMHYYNAGSFFDAMMTLARPFISDKFRSRIKVHSTLESLYKHVPPRLLPEEYLPDDYTGSCAGSLQQIVDNYQEEVTSEEFRQQMLSRTSSKYGIDLSKKPQNDVPQASFRKLSVD